MNTPEGPVFCPGCPNTGNFVGTVSVEQLSVGSKDKVDSRNYGGQEQGKVESYVRFVDEDGMKSEKIGFSKHYGFLAEHTRQEINPEEDATRLEAQAETIVTRIGRCVGKVSSLQMNKGYGSENVNCPAVNSEVLQHLTDNAKS